VGEQQHSKGVHTAAAEPVQQRLSSPSQDVELHPTPAVLHDD